MLFHALLAALALSATPAAPSPSPSPTPSGPPLKEIGTVNAVGSYCATFYRRFNAVVHPMLENDATLDRVSVTLDDINEVFGKTNREQLFYDQRLRMMKYVSDLEANTWIIQREVNNLREAQTYTTDPVKSKEMHMLAQELQRALDKQKQMSTDLMGIVHVMMDFKITPDDLTGQPLGDFTFEKFNLPKDAKDLKSYLRFNGMRDRLRDAERMSADHAETIMQKFC